MAIVAVLSAFICRGVGTAGVLTDVTASVECAVNLGGEPEGNIDSFRGGNGGRSGGRRVRPQLGS